MAMKDNWFLVLYLKTFLNDYVYTLGKSADLWLLKQEYRALVPDVFYPEEWAYGALFRACEDLMVPEFGLEMWNDLLRRNRVLKVETIERVCGALSARVDPSDADKYIEALRTVRKKVELQKMKYPPFLISQFIRLHTLVDELDKAWEFYGYFEKYSIQPTFLALSSLLKGHYGRRDGEKVAEVMDIMIDLGMHLPAVFVKDVCYKCGVSREVRDRLVAGLSRDGQTKQVVTLHSASSRDE